VRRHTADRRPPRYQHPAMARQEETMQDDKDRFLRAAAITAALTLSCTIGVLYLPLFLR